MTHKTKVGLKACIFHLDSHVVTLKGGWGGGGRGRRRRTGGRRRGASSVTRNHLDNRSSNPQRLKTSQRAFC